MVNKSSRKRQNVHIKRSILIFLLVLVAGSVLILYFHLNNDQCNSNYNCGGSVANSLPPCTGNNLLSYFPIQLDKIQSIIPLGHLTPTGSHSTPMEHIELLLANNSQGQPTEANIVSTAKVHIFAVRQSIYLNNGVIQTSNYYSLGYASCKDVIFYYEAMDGISGSLQAAIDSTKVKYVQTQTEGTREFKFTTYRINYVAQPGEVIGTIGGSNAYAATLEWGAYDTRIPKLAFLGNSAYGNQQLKVFIDHAVCPLDYYSGQLKQQLYAKLLRKVAPRCGTNMQDLAGTIQGDWITHSHIAADNADWRSILSIVHDNINPSIGVIAIGGTITHPSTVDFTPTQNGSVNREPSQVKADGKVYCYQNNLPPTTNSPQTSGKVLVQLINLTSLKIENQQGRCNGNDAFLKPYTYNR